MSHQAFKSSPVAYCTTVQKLKIHFTVGLQMLKNGQQISWPDNHSDLRIMQS